LNQRLDEESLSNKYDSEFNNYRQRLLDLISTHLRSEISHFNELVFNRKNNNGQIAKHELEKPRNVNFKKSIIRSEEMCIMRLIMIEFRLRCKFSASQLIEYGQILGISKYLIQKENILDSDESLRNALAEFSNLENEIIRLFIDVGANVNARGGYDNETTLTFASIYDHFELVKYLVEHGADVNATNKDNNNTALIEASAKGHLEIVKYLVENGADVNARDEDNKTALIFACENGHLEIVKYLIQNGANLNANSKRSGEAALIIAYDKGHLEIVKCLVEHGADVNAKGFLNETALMYASSRGHLEVVQYLIEHGADVNAKDIYRHTALILASYNENFEMVKQLIEHGADSNPSTAYFDTALMIATRNGHLETVKYLIQAIISAVGFSSSFLVTSAPFSTKYFTISK
jgi:ankyrin repeat protein